MEERSEDWLLHGLSDDGREWSATARYICDELDEIINIEQTN